MSTPDTSSRYSIARLERFWYPVCLSRELGTAPISRTLMGTPIVLFRSERREPAALLDRCPHRNVPLSAGRSVGGTLQCAYHGWRFDGAGACVEVPGHLGAADGAGRRAPAFAACEQGGLVYVWGKGDDPPEGTPFRAERGGAGSTTVQRVVDFPGTLHATIENALDVPHTAYLHRGLFRGSGERHDIEAVVTRTERSAECEYIGEPRPEGIAARLLSPSGGIVRHWDRFFLPSVAQVEYRIGDESHFVVTSEFSPVDDFLTRAFATITFRLRVPGLLVRPLIDPIAMRIFRQDAWVLELQSKTVRSFGGERYSSTEIDLLGAQVWRLMHLAAEGRLEPDPEPWRKSIRLRV